MNLKRILISFLLSSLFFWGINVLEFNLENLWLLNKNLSLGSSLALNAKADLISLKIKKPEKIEIQAKSALSLLVDEKGNKKILYRKNIDQKLPIASLTKLMSGYIIVNYFDLSKTIEVRSEALLKRNLGEKFYPGQKFFIKDLLYASLIESNNNGINILASIIGKEPFLYLMNKEAKNMGLLQTKFFNPTGLDPKKNDEMINFSTALDLAKLSLKVFKNPILKEALSAKEFDLYETNGFYHHKSLTTNILLNDSFKGMRIIGGKTGETPRAGGCLVMVLKDSSKKEILINVILGSENRFEEMKKMINWAIKTLKYQHYLKSFLI